MGVIFYHDFEPNILVSRTLLNQSTSDAFQFDFNNDGRYDLGFGYRLQQVTLGGNAIFDNTCTTGSQGHHLIADLDTGYLVQSICDPTYYKWGNFDYYLVESSGCTSNNGDIYIGFISITEEVQPHINATRNFGWLRIEVVNPDSLIIKDYAYNLIENSPIRIGNK